MVQNSFLREILRSNKIGTKFCTLTVPCWAETGPIPCMYKYETVNFCNVRKTVQNYISLEMRSDTHKKLYFESILRR